MNDTFDRFLREHFISNSDYSSFDEAFLSEFLKLGPLHCFIPTSLGGTYDSTATCMTMLETVSYYCLPLGLALGITGSLFFRIAFFAADGQAGPEGTQCRDLAAISG